MAVQPPLTAMLGLFIILGLLACVMTQPRNTAPETLQSCYKNITALNRGNRQPVHITNLIAILRKIEQKAYQFRDMRRLARTIVKRFQFDGIYHDPDKSLELQFAPHPLESIKTSIVHGLVQDNADVLPTDVLDNDEKCILHWMVSHSLNSTLRDDEEVERYQRYNNGGLRAKRATGSNTRKTKRPIETGTVYTDWGPISAGRVIAGIATGLMVEYQTVVFKSDGSAPGDGGQQGGSFPPNNNNGGTGGFGGPGGVGGGGNNNNWNNNNNPQYNNPWNQYPGRKKRQAGGTTFQDLQNLHAATLAGDIGQAAILNSPYYQRISGLSPPVGVWNDTICPREYILNALQDPMADPSHEHDTWSYMTGAEIRGGMDGLILASKAKELSDKGFTLSQVLEMYYSDEGIYGQSSIRSCDRTSVFPGLVDMNVVKQQSRSFAYYYNSKVQKVVVTDKFINVFESLVDQAFSKMTGFQSTIASDPQCLKRAPSSGFVVPDQEKESKVLATVYAIPDHSTTYEELVAQQRFIAKLAFELDVSPRGSRLGMVDGRSGQVLISPNFTDTAPILACRILKQPQSLQPGNLAQILKTLKQELIRVRDEQVRRGEVWGAGSVTILVFVQGKKLEDSQRNNILNVLREYDREFGGIQVTYTSSKYTKQDFDKFVLDTGNEANFIPIQPQQSGNLSDSSSIFLKEFAKRAHIGLKYDKCNEYKYPDQSKELLDGQDLPVTAHRFIDYYMISPAFFFTSVDLRLRFTSDNGKVRICASREQKYPINYSPQENENRNIECRETSGTYSPPESMTKDVEFTYTRPCRDRESEGCDPIYLSITTTDVPADSGAMGVDCSDGGCLRPDEVRVTWTHYDMRCNGGYNLSPSSIGSILSICLAIFYFQKKL